MPNLAPLAERMRPQNLDEYVGQKHLVGKDAVLRKAIQSGQLPSMIFWGPPGVGKTTLAYIISKTLDRPFFNHIFATSNRLLTLNYQPSNNDDDTPTATITMNHQLSTINYQPYICNQ